MPFNGSGVFSLSQPAFNNGAVADATAVNSDLSDIATGLTNTLTKDGQSTPTANIKLGNFKLTGLGVGTASGDALAYGQALVSTGITNTSAAITATLDSPTYQGRLATSAGSAGIQIQDQTSGRKLEFYYFGTTSAGAYGAVAGESVINAANGVLCLSTTDNVRAKILNSGLIVVSGSLGYGSGAGGVVTQASSKATGVTLNTATGQITMNAASLAAGASANFQLTNSLITATDVVAPSLGFVGTTLGYAVTTQTFSGGCVFRVTNNTAGALAEAVLINYVLIKGASA